MKLLWAHLICSFKCEKKQLARKAKEEEERLKEMRNSSYIIYDEYEPDKFIGKNQLSYIIIEINTFLFDYPKFSFSVPSLLDSDENRKPFGENEHFQQTFDAVWEAHVQQLIPCKSCGKKAFFLIRL